MRQSKKTKRDNSQTLKMIRFTITKRAPIFWDNFKKLAFKNFVTKLKIYFEKTQSLIS